MVVQTDFDGDEKDFILKQTEQDCLFLCTRQGMRTFMPLQRVISGRRRLHTHTEGIFRPASANDSHISRDILTISDDLSG